VKGLLLLRDLLLTAFAVALLWPLYVLPWRAAGRLGHALGTLVSFVWPLSRRTAMVNLRRAYGAEMTRERAARIARAVVGNLGQGIAEGIQFGRRFKRGEPGWEQIVTVEDPALEARILADPRPKVFVTGHLGSWEIATMIAGLRAGRRGAAIVRRVDNPFLNAVVRRLRLADPAQWIEKKGSADEALRRLRAGDSIALLLDENGGRRGIFVDFFGRPASTQKTAALLSLATGAPVVLGAVVRRGGGFLYRLALLEPPRPDERRGGADILELTQRIVSLYEAWVRDDPEQWRWVHWRWRTRPDGTEETYGRRDVEDAFA